MKLTKEMCEKACLYLLNHCYEEDLSDDGEHYIFTLSGSRESNIFKQLIEEHFKLVDKYNNVCGVSLDRLKELVERATPKKVKNKKIYYYPETYEIDYINAYCPCCSKRISIDEYHKDNYCNNCGQKISWEEDDEI